MARSISKSVTPELPPWGGICRIPLIAFLVRLVRPCAARLLQAFVSPIFGAPLAPEPWPAIHAASPTPLPPRGPLCACAGSGAIARARMTGMTSRSDLINEERLARAIRPIAFIAYPFGRKRTGRAALACRTAIDEITSNHALGLSVLINVKDASNTACGRRIRLQRRL